MRLEKYKKKRDFSETSEPQGGKVFRNSLVFVIQKHEATRLHYDFRLEMEGVLKSWAIPKGPSLDPTDKRFAKMTEDHPYDYRNFEGVIPKGNYGAGQVIIWDEGTYSSIEGGSKKKQEKELFRGLEKGDLKVVLNGKKLKGEFVLVRMKDDDWLLIKHKDEFVSKEDILENDRSVRSGKTIENITGSDPVDMRKYREAKKSLLPEKVKPMLATLIDKPFDDLGFLFELKWDGYRAIAEVSGENVLLYSRNFKSFNQKYPSIVDSLKKFKTNIVLDGEIVVVDEKGIPNFQMLQNYNGLQGNLVYYVFDILYYDKYLLFDLPLIKRKEILSKLIPANVSNIKVSDFVKEKGKDFFELVEKRGLEGVVGKRMESLYLQGKRTMEWVKIKALMRQEAVIGGFTDPRSGRKYFGSLMLGVYDSGKLRYIGHSGGGFSDKTLKSLFEILKKDETKRNPFEKNRELIGKDSWGVSTKIHWVKPKFVCEVKFSEWTEEGIMRQPVFLGLRDDKTAQEVGEETKEIFFGKEGPKEGETQKIQGSSKTFEFSNLDKVWWRDQAITKKELIEYYNSVSSIILPYLKDRPENLNRFPDGIDGESFYQKNIGNFKADWMKTIKIESDTEERTIEYIICNDRDTLLYLANLGCIELNPWNSRTRSLEYPDYLVIDLDPEAISFKYVVKAALEVQKVLGELGIKSYCKTSGATGLHIYVSSGAKYTHEQVRQFAELVAQLVHKRIPDFTSIERSPSKRQEKVYLDFLQNRIGQTLACAYSARPKKGATVSTPLFWEEVNEDLQPSKFTIKNTKERIERIGDLWKETLGQGFNMEKSLLRVESLVSKTFS